jgi:2-C-methyl-D-erythritol 4-phosphate cytidylyltransferase
MAYTSKYAVIVAGGKGVRMGGALPKQFMPLLGKPVLYYSVNAFISAFADIKLVLVLPKDQLSYAQMVLKEFPDGIDIMIVSGGETRFHSVQNGLKAIEEDSIVFVHDGARPLVSSGLIRQCFDQALELGSAIPAVHVSESMRLIEDDDSRPVDREFMRIIQTPQVFRSDILLPAFGQEYIPSFTDEATVVEAFGIRIFLIEGEKSNIKITTPDDMVIAEALLANMKI